MIVHANGVWRIKPILSHCFTCFLLSYGASAGDKPEYAVQRIPSSLIEGAGAIYRLTETTFDVMDEGGAVQRRRIAVTVFRQDEREEGELTLWYDRFRRITDLDGALYDASGEEIRSLSKEDTKDYSAISSYSLYEDARVRLVQLYHDQYPYTVELSFEISYDGYIEWPAWYAQPTDHPSEESRFTVTLPTAMPLRHWSNNDSLQFAETMDGNRTSYTWQAAMLPGIPDELKNENREDLTTVVRIAPSRFALGGSEGDLSSWKSFGEWCGKLYAGRDQLPEVAAHQVDSIVRGIESPREKARALYRHLQSRTRYVSIQLGIGGWQPFDATYVSERGYGDCKALSNYMVSLLKRAGLTAYPVLIDNGTLLPPLRTEFPSNQFNHVIVCVPFQKDTTWLECTSQSMPFGRVGASNENRDALMITPDGGVIVRVPPSMPRQNFQRRRAQIVLNSYGTAEATVVTKVGGNQHDHLRSALVDATPLERERWITDAVTLQNMKLVNYSVQGLESKEDVASLSLRLSLPRYASTSGERMFFNPNLMERNTSVPPERPKKHTPVRFSYRYFDMDSVEYRIPNQFKCEALPSPTTLKAPFGEFSSTTSCVGDTLIFFTRSLEIKASEVPPERYPEYRSFFAGVAKADRGQVVLVHK
jgi:transglutaminase-like putative cysteine protease